MTPEELEELALAASEPDHATRPRQQHPKGWEPGVRFDKDTGEACVILDRGQEDKWRAVVLRVLERFGMGDAVDIVGDTPQLRMWDSPTKDDPDKQSFYVKATLAKRVTVDERADWQALYDEISNWPVNPPPRVIADEQAMVWLFGDMQLGKPDGDGSRGTLRRFGRSLNRLIDRLREHARRGDQITHLYVCALGDLIENCDGHYPMQTFGTDLNMREQTRALLMALQTAVNRLAECVPRLTVAAVPGNHGEVRKNGKAYTSFGDNWDVAIPEFVAAASAARPELAHVNFVIPKEELTVTLDVLGAILGLAHSHQARKGGNVQTRVLGWWDDMAAVRHPIGDADVLATAHNHHLQIVDRGAQVGTKTWIQVPALDGGSEWWGHQGGGQCVPGTVSLLMGRQFERGWAEPRLL